MLILTELLNGFSLKFNTGVYASPNIISVIKSRRVSWTGHVARMEEMRNVYRILGGKPEEKGTRKT